MIWRKWVIESYSLRHKLAQITLLSALQHAKRPPKFVTAGFWNSHVHIFTPGLLHAGTESAAKLDAELDAMLNRWGSTTVFDLASVLDNTLTLRHRIDNGEVRGPRILTVGETLWTAVPI